MEGYEQERKLRLERMREYESNFRPQRPESEDEEESVLVQQPFHAPAASDAAGTLPAEENLIELEAESVEVVNESDDDEVVDSKLSPSHFLTHFPKNSNCPICNASNLKRRQARRRVAPISLPRIGSLVGADHLISGAVPGINGDTVCLITNDVYSRFAGAYPAVSKDSQESFNCLEGFTSDMGDIGLRTDNSRELIAAGQMLKVVRKVTTTLSVPYRHTSNSIQQTTRLPCTYR
jgi:hypothetical protein